MFIPKHLEKISEVIKTSKIVETAKIKCECGNYHFFVYKFCEQSNANIKNRFDKIIRENDKLYLIKRNFFGKVVDKIECEDLFKKERRIIKVKCEKCGKEYILFDNYKHGYDAVINNQESDILRKDTTFDFKKMNQQSIEVYVKIFQDISYEEFKEEFENMNYSSYLNSFGNIEIYYLNSFGNIEIYGKKSKFRKINIYSEETA